MRTRIVLSVGAFVIAAGAFAGTALASAATTAPTPPRVTSTTAAPAPPTAQPTVSAPPTPSQRGVTTAPAPAVRAPGQVTVPRAVPAGPTGDLHLPAITEGD